MKASPLISASLLLLGMVTVELPAADPGVPARPNVVFIAVDDLNHWVGYTGRNRQTKTPNLDRLAAMGTSFTNAHCAAPVCNPSRTALLSGRRPGQTGVYDNGIPYQSGAGVTAAGALVTQFKNAGYETVGMGKIWHGGLGFSEQWERQKEEPRLHPKVKDRSIAGIRFGIVEGGDEDVEDTATAAFAVAELEKAHERPFFLGLGFHKPHMPWNVPEKYYAMHPLESIELPPLREGDLDDIPEAGRKMAHLNADHQNVLKSGRWKEAIQAYLAAVSYLDGQVGRVLDALERSRYRENTVICLWGDHGWHLGEKEHWRKFALWEEATRAPLMWVVPGLTKPGTLCGRPVDFMSIYPTLCDVAGIAKPEGLAGPSIRPLLADAAAAWNTPAVTTHGRNNHAVRSERWRYIRYADGSEELYDHDADPYEWKNLAADPGLAGVKAELGQWLPKENCPEAGTGGKGKKKGAKAGKKSGAEAE